jgi:hypothetical protein
MRRASLFGLAWFFASIGIAYAIDKHGWPGLIILFQGLFTAWAFRWAARRAPPAKSRLKGIAGWLLGFLAIPAASWAVIGIIYFTSR